MTQLGKWMGTALVDMLDRQFALGDRVARAYKGGQAVNIKISVVTRLEDGKLYLDDSKVAVVYPGRLLIVNESVPTI